MIHTPCQIVQILGKHHFLPVPPPVYFGHLQLKQKLATFRELIGNKNCDYQL